MITNVPLRKMALAIAHQHGADGAIVILKSSDGTYRIGLSGLTDVEIQNALCVGIHHNFLQMGTEDGEAD